MEAKHNRLIRVLAVLLGLGLALWGGLRGIEWYIDKTLLAYSTEECARQGGQFSVRELHYSVLENSVTSRDGVISRSSGQTGTVRLEFGLAQQTDVRRKALWALMRGTLPAGAALAGSTRVERVRVTQDNALLAEIQEVTCGTLTFDPEAFAAARDSKEPWRVFLGEKPLLDQYSLRGLTLGPWAGNLKADSLRWENPATDPFTFTLTLDGLKVPVAAFPELVYAGLLGYAELDLGARVSGVLPSGGQAPAALRVSLSGRDVGTLDVDMDAVFARRLSVREFFMDAVSDEAVALSALRVRYTEGGLLAHVARAAAAMLGPEPELLIPYAVAFLWAMVPEASRTPKTRELITQIEAFLARPGALTLSLALPKPVPFGQLGSLPEELLHVEVLPGPKKLAELMQK